jgi:hypothetical protein
VAGSLSARGAQLVRGPLAGGDEIGVATQSLHEPGRAAPAGFQIAREMHAAHHALPRIAGRARQQLRAPLRHHVGE